MITARSVPVVPNERVIAALIVSVTLVVSGCDSHSSTAGTSSDSHHEATSSATSPPTAPTRLTASGSSAPTSPASAAEGAAVAAYLGMWQDFTTAAHTSDWRSPLLAQHATAYALQVITKSLYTDHQNGVVTQGQPVDHPRVTSVSPQSDPTVVLISDCGNSRGTRKYDAKTGAPTGRPGGRQAITAEVRQQPDGSWKVDQFAVKGVGSC